MLTRDTLPRSGAPRATRLLCSCGAEITRVEAGVAVLRSGDAQAEQVRALTCGACGRAVSVPLAREGAR